MRTLCFVAAALLAACGTTRPPALRLDRVVLYQSGIGHFERAGVLSGDRLRLVLRPHEVDDVIKTFKRDEPKVGRNDPCPCGSGRKYKKCHGAAA